MTKKKRDSEPLDPVKVAGHGAEQAMDAATEAFRRGDYPTAIHLLEQACHANPTRSDLHTNLGAACLAGGDLPRAEKSLRRALDLDPTCKHALNNLGELLRARGQLEEAKALIRRALEQDEAFPEAHCNLGAVLSEQGKYKTALERFERGLSLRPDYAEGWINLGLAHLAHEASDEAVAAFRRAVRENPKAPEAYNNLANALRKTGVDSEAMACYVRALELRPDYARAHHNLAVLLADHTWLDEALYHLEQAITVNPEFVEAHCKLGNVHADRNHFAEAHASYERALAIQPDAVETHFCRATAYLMQGDFARGWKEYEWRLQRADHPGLCSDRPTWDGKPMPGKTLLLQTEQGMGDTFQSIRFAAQARTLVGTLLLGCPERLVPLLSRYPGIDQAVPLQQPLPEHDVHLPLMSLPCRLGTTQETLPSTVPYLFAEPQRITLWQKRLATLKGFKVGIAWHGARRPVGTCDHRNIPLGNLLTLAEIPGIVLVNLQKGAGVEQLDQVPSHPMVLPGDEVDTTDGAFLDTAAIMMNLDLVITPDTCLAHLAGALGVPTWTLLCTTPEWRWFHDREDSPWYPGMRLFRQRTPGDWSEVMERVADALEAKVRNRP